MRHVNQEEPEASEPPPPTKFCHACGETIDRRAEICPECGVRQPGVGDSGPSRIAAALFAILLGGIGAHKFYLGRPGLGIVYLIFFWTFIPAIVGIVEGLIMLSQSDRDFALKMKHG